MWAELFLPWIMIDYITKNKDYTSHLLCTLMWYSTEDTQWQGCLDTNLNHAITTSMMWGLIVLGIIFFVGCIITAVYINRRRAAMDNKPAGQADYVYEEANAEDAQGNVIVNTADEHHNYLDNSSQ